MDEEPQFKIRYLNAIAEPILIIPEDMNLDKIIVCGPDGFRHQGNCSVSIEGVEVTDQEKAFRIQCREIDFLLVIPPLQPPASSNSSSSSTPASTGVQRRFGSATVPPPHWYTLGIGTKDFLFFEISVPTQAEQELIYKALVEYIKMAVWKRVKSGSVAFNCSGSNHDGWNAFSPEEDFAKEIASGIVRVSRVNENFRICSTYPEANVVPASIDDEVIAEAATDRRNCRFPVIKYYHSVKSTILATAAEFSSTSSCSGSRVSQMPASDDSSSISSVVLQRCTANEKLLEAMLPPGKRGLIIDLRSHGNSAASSKFKKTNAEMDRFDQRWKRIAKPLPEINEIHSIFVQFIRDITRPAEIAPQQNANSSLSPSIGYSLTSFLPLGNADLSTALRSSPAGSSDDMAEIHGAFAGVKVSLKKSSAWLGLVRDTLATAVAGACALDGRDLAARNQLDHDRAALTRSAGCIPEAELKARLAVMTTSGASLLIVGGDGRDQCLLVSALVQVILSPAVRTIRGFEALIQREWISAGHAFSERCSHLLTQSSDSMLTVAAPVFLLFLDCIWQIWCQYPSSFEFNEEFLLYLVKHVYAFEFGTFLGDSDQMRGSLRLSKNTDSFWSHVNSDDVLSKIRNCLYSPPSQDADSESLSCWPCLSPQALNIWREVYQRVVLPYPCRIWSDRREALVDAYAEYREALSTAQKLEKIVRDLMDEASERNLLPAK
ncbi:Myotubularin-related protein 9 [Echinococcus granulosus]|uniref:Myotubularin-related protein 9 n=1 Tax=Echinococcus granulosus TaxID=6210 RepID=W6UAY4_ECHGR|nr:Myotubularin-related protein 9 [Echinococcus granulosus]EUB58250.1 Myotubularin-related protein 9 [Echinococcus granulosus]